MSHRIYAEHCDNCRRPLGRNNAGRCSHCGENNPTPAEIAKRSAAVRAGWTPAVELERRTAWWAGLLVGSPPIPLDREAEDQSVICTNPAA